MTETRLEPLVFEFSLACDVEHAFTTWTAKMDRWWPKDHSKSGDLNTTVSLEGHVGGRILERSDGVEFEWGRITEWDPPNKLAYLWYIGSTPSQPTLVELSFDDVAAGTKVRLVHSGWNVFGNHGLDRRTDNRLGWASVLETFQAEFERLT